MSILQQVCIILQSCFSCHYCNQHLGKKIKFDIHLVRVSRPCLTYAFPNYGTMLCNSSMTSFQSAVHISMSQPLLWLLLIQNNLTKLDTKSEKYNAFGPHHRFSMILRKTPTHTKQEQLETKEVKPLVSLTLIFKRIKCFGDRQHIIEFYDNNGCGRKSVLGAR